jgi:hypothetical protein
LDFRGIWTLDWGLIYNIHFWNLLRHELWGKSWLLQELQQACCMLALPKKRILLEGMNDMAH